MRASSFQDSHELLLTCLTYLVMTLKAGVGKQMGNLAVSFPRFSMKHSTDSLKLAAIPSDKINISSKLLDQPGIDAFGHRWRVVFHCANLIGNIV